MDLFGRKWKKANAEFRRYKATGVVDEIGMPSAKGYWLNKKTGEKRPQVVLKLSPAPSNTAITGGEFVIDWPKDWGRFKAEVAGFRPSGNGKTWCSDFVGDSFTPRQDSKGKIDKSLRKLEVDPKQRVMCAPADKVLKLRHALGLD